MSKTRRNHGSAFKAKVALEALKGEQTVAEIASKLHPTLVNEWKRQLAEGASSRKRSARPRRTARRRALQANRPAESGTGFFGTQALSRAERHPMIDRLNKHLSLTRQCQLLGLSRSSLYYQPATDNTEDLALMALIVPGDAVLRLAQDWLRREGHVVNRKRRLMRQMGLQVIWQKPNTSKPNPEHKVYPYLLRGLTIEHQVWATDITYIPMPKRFFYLVAIMDWHSRKVLSWRLSNTMDAIFCVEALEEALALYGRPEIFNSDQGAQFTIHRRAGGRRRSDQHGRQRPLHG